MSRETLAADPSPVTPSYVMHYPESLFGDAASIAPGLITIDDLHAAQKASAVVGVSAISATSTGRKSRDSGIYQPGDSEPSVGKRMRRFISIRRGDSSERRSSDASAHEERSRSPTQVLADAREKIASQHRSARTSLDSRRPSEAASTVEVGADDGDEDRVARIDSSKSMAAIPGAFPSAGQQSGDASDADAADSQAQGAFEGDAAADEAGKDRHRRHSLMGVFKRIFR
ncbi:hypothetical protein H4R21_002367 [Coemansia helicoidea]|uniref:Uncharacterized protein n=1 Tax=Coemansia helicoidea TaxID=1286919 RepID=A0ACC1L733_9FUNG|nr:hypothetical protein H4R21_002367 [Coemansia helicoidea]